MPWIMTGNLDEFQHAAGALLRSEPVHNTVPLTVLTTLRESGLSAFGDSPPVFGWHESEVGAVDGAILQTPPHPVLVAELPAGSAQELVEELIASGRRPAAVNVTASSEVDASSAWATATGSATTVRQRVRLFRLAGLAPPDPFPPGRRAGSRPGRPRPARRLASGIRPRDRRAGRGERRAHRRQPAQPQWANAVGG